MGGFNPSEIYHLDLKDDQDVTFLKENLIPKAHILLESYRPGVMERLSLGPTDIHRLNPNLIYARLTGFG